MTRTITPEEKIWDYLRGMSCTASSAIDDWSNINFAISEAFSFLSPLSGLGFIQDDTHELEKHLIELEAAALMTEDRVACINRDIQKINTTLKEMKEDSK